MRNPCTRAIRRFLLIGFFLAQFVLFSIYAFVYYQNSDDEIVSLEYRTKPASPDQLPASRLEKSARISLSKTYINVNEYLNDEKNDTRSYEQLQLLNVSFVVEDNRTKTIVQCPILPPNLVGPVEADFMSYEMDEIEQLYANSNIQHGGHWSPDHCTARNRVAVIIPYRNRQIQLHIFLKFMHNFLQKQQLDYGIFLIEPIAGLAFNRALLFNIGFQEASKLYAWECFVFHDVDLIPEDDRNIYSCPIEPRHMSVAVNTLNYELPYRTIFGGVSAMTHEQYSSINGFSNQFFGWGGEDDDMAARILTKYRISRYPASIARYRMVQHQPDTPNWTRYRLLGQSAALHAIDGLSNLNYTVVEIHKKPLYTLIRVSYDEAFIKSKVAHLPIRGVPQWKRPSQILN